MNNRERRPQGDKNEGLIKEALSASLESKYKYVPYLTLKMIELEERLDKMTVIVALLVGVNVALGLWVFLS